MFDGPNEMGHSSVVDKALGPRAAEPGTAPTEASGSRRVATVRASCMEGQVAQQEPTREKPPPPP